MPRTYHAVKYCFLSPIHDSDGMKWTAKNSHSAAYGSFDEICEHYKSEFRSLFQNLGTSCDVTPQLGYYTIDETTPYSRVDYKWFSNGSSNEQGTIVGPDFQESGPLRVVLPHLETFLQNKSKEVESLVVKPAMSLMFTFYSGEHDVVRYVPSPSSVVASTPQVQQSVKKIEEEEDDGPVPNLFGDDDEW